MENKPTNTLQRAQIYLPAPVIERVKGFYPGLKTSEALRLFIMASLQQPAPQTDPAQMHIKEIAENIKTKKGSKK